MRIPLADIHGVLNFHTMFYREPVGERNARVCTDLACAIAGGFLTPDQLDTPLTFEALSALSTALALPDQWEQVEQ
jgi:NADH:ubiquinone oxidoreductase subunit E